MGQRCAIVDIGVNVARSTTWGMNVEGVGDVSRAGSRPKAPVHSHRMTSRFPILICGVLLLANAAARAADASDGPAQMVAAPDDNSAPRVVVPPLLGLDVKKGAAPYKLLVTELAKAIGPRVVDVADVLKAQQELGLVATDFDSAVGLEKLATATTAERVVTVDIGAEMTTVRVYGSLTGAPPLVIELPRRKKSALDGKWARATAAAIATRAEDTLAARMQAPVIELSLADTPPPPVEPPPVAATVATLPWLMAAVGGGVALRVAEVSGPLANKVAPMNQGIVPSVSGYVGLRPLVVSAPGAWFNDLLIEAWGRRGIAEASTGSETCAVDDDDVTAAISWRARLSDNPLVPRLGAGVSGSLERFVISGCSLPALSTTSTQTAAFARLGWAVVPGFVDVDALGGVRVPVVGGGSGFERPGALGQVAINATPVPGLRFLFVRAVARVFESRLIQGSRPDLVVEDLRSSFELQLGGAL